MPKRKKNKAYTVEGVPNREQLLRYVRNQPNALELELFDGVWEPWRSLKELAERLGCT